MVMSPPLALLLGARVAVPVVLLLESLVAAPTLVRTWHLVDWRRMSAILAAACLTVPLGTMILLALAPETIRRAIAITVVVFAVILLRGWRYSGRPRVATSIGLGAVSGGMLGATSIGGPPVILYLLSGPDSIDTTRANLMLYVTVTSLVGIVMLWHEGLFGVRTIEASLWLAPAYYLGLMAGIRLFPKFSDTRFRQFTLVLLIGVSTGILLAR